MDTTLRVVLFGFGLMVSLATVAKGDIVFTNLGPGGTFDCCSGFGLKGSSLTPPPYALAAEFVPTADLLFTDAELALSVNLGTASAEVYLMTDASGVPGTVLEQFTVTGLQPTPSGALFTVDSLLNPELQMGVPYWLAVTPVDASSSVSWRRDLTELNSGSDLADLISSPSLTGPWNIVSVDTSAYKPAFEIDGTVVPEPNLLLVSLSGLAAVGVWRRTHRRSKV
jgi:hypothetical protein